MMKIRNILGTILLLGVFIIGIENYNAKTLGDLKNELSELEKKQAAQKAAYEAERKARIDAQKKQQQEALTKFQNKLYGN